MKVFITFIMFLFIGSININAQSTTTTSSTVHYTCSGKNKQGNDCKQIVKTKGAKCRFHSDTKITCSGVTTKKKPCQMVVTKKGEYCWRHKK